MARSLSRSRFALASSKRQRITDPPGARTCELLRQRSFVALRDDSRRGQSTVEFALAASVLLLFMLVFVDLGRGIYAYSLVAEAAQEGARYGIANPTDIDGIRAAAQQRLVGLDEDQLTITPSIIGSNAVEVRVEYLFQPVTPWISAAVGQPDGILLSSTARMCRGVCT